MRLPRPLILAPHDSSPKMLEAPAIPRIITADAGGAEVVYNGICAGCHAYNVRLIGPPALVIQAQYGDDAQAIADYG